MSTILFFLILAIHTSSALRNFTIDHENNCFLKDGQPFRYVSGSLHYFRVPQQYWRDRMEKMKAAGLNALQTYVEWSGHEPEPSEYNFQDNYDLVKFLQTANEVGLLVIFRPGPYICAERDMGGFPYWLMRENPDIQLRTMDPSYIEPVDRWMKYLINLIVPLLYKNGGPIILIQVENEYGQHDRCDKLYMAHLRDLTWALVGQDVILFRTDIPLAQFYDCDMADGVMVTGDLGSGTDIETAFKTMRLYDKTGPIVITEYYPGWMDHWGEPHANVNADAICKTLDDILKANGSVNFYMFHGGTNFEFSNGANAEYSPQPTSYDYGAPLSEAGDPTTLYLKIRDIVGKYLPLPPGPVPVPSPKFSMTNPIDFIFVGSMMDSLPVLGQHIFSTYPKTFEELNLSQGFAVYSTLVQFITHDPSLLTIDTVRDRAYVLVQKRLVGILDRKQKINSMPVLIQKDQILTLIVENQGRINYGEETKDPKGLLSNVTLNGITLKHWVITPVPLNDTKVLHQLLTVTSSDHPTHDVPGFFTANFTLPSGVQPVDTFLDPRGWFKGVAFINNFNLGRYWPVMGPQVTLYVPGCYLKPYPENNTLTVLELERAPCISGVVAGAKTPCHMKLVDTPQLDGPVP